METNSKLPDVILGGVRDKKAQLSKDLAATETTLADLGAATIEEKPEPKEVTQLQTSDGDGGSKTGPANNRFRKAVVGSEVEKGVDDSGAVKKQGEWKAEGHLRWNKVGGNESSSSVASAPAAKVAYKVDVSSSSDEEMDSGSGAAGSSGPAGATQLTPKQLAKQAKRRTLRHKKAADKKAAEIKKAAEEKVAEECGSSDWPKLAGGKDTSSGSKASWYDVSEEAAWSESAWAASDPWASFHGEAGSDKKWVSSPPLPEEVSQLQTSGGKGGSGKTWRDSEKRDLSKVNPEWPLVSCSTANCATVEKWRKMISTKLWDTDSDEYVYIYTCWMCVAKKEGFSGDTAENEARSFIYRASSSFQCNEERNKKFREGLAGQIELQPALVADGKTKILKEITRASFKLVMMPMRSALLKKSQHMFAMGDSHEARKLLLSELAACRNKDRSLEIMKELDKMYQRDRMVGFAEHPHVLKQETVEAQQVMQDRMQMASTYSDEWCSTVVDGELVYIRFYFICQRRTHKRKWEGNRTARCMHLTLSDDWIKKFQDDPLSWQQGWKCACQAGYMPGLCGCIVEMRLPGVPGVCYARAEVPDGHINDVRAIFHEETIKPLSDLDLYQKVPRIAPATTQVVKESNDYPGWWYVDHEDFDQLLELNWYVIFALFGLEIKEHETKNQAKDRRWIEWSGTPEQRAALAAADEKKKADKEASTHKAITHFLGGGASSSSAKA